MKSSFHTSGDAEMKPYASQVLRYIPGHVTSKFITLTHCPQLLWKTRMNQINIEEALSDLAACLCSRRIQQEEKRG